MTTLARSRPRTPARPWTVRRDLEGMRAIAVLGVVAYHCRPSRLPGGFAGVDVFFVLSGFFITGLLLREAAASSTIDLRAFWGRRARRLLPASVLVLVVTVLASVVLVDPLDAGRFAVDGAFAATFSVNWHHAALGTSYLSDPTPSPVTHYWSLGLEEQFYLVWPVVLLALVIACRRRLRRLRWSLRSTVIALASVIGIVSFVVALRLTTGNQPYAYFATYSRAWQLALGALLAAVGSASRVPSSVLTVARWIGVGTIMAFYLAAPADVAYPGWAALLPAGGAALVVFAGLPTDRATRRDPLVRVLSSSASQHLGRYSYGWYLWHWPPLVLVPLAVGHPLGRSGLVLCAAGSLLAAVAMYHLLEQPVRSNARLTAHRGRWSLALGAVLVLGSLTLAQGGVSYAHWTADHALIENADGTALRPQPGAAATQEPVPLRDGCEVSLSADALAPDCRYLPDRGRGDIVLVGDSHAAQWFSAVHGLAADRAWGLRVWTRASCPLADVSKIYAGGPSRACDRWRADVMRRLVAARPSLVVVASYASRVPTIYDRTTGRLVGGPAAARLYEAGLRANLTRLRAAGIPVLMIRDNPSFDVSAPECVLGHARALTACGASKHQALHTAADLHAGQAVTGVHVLDLTGRYCNARRCSQVLGATLAYRDTNHLTDEMVSRLAPEVARAAYRTLA